MFCVIDTEVYFRLKSMSVLLLLLLFSFDLRDVTSEQKHSEVAWPCQRVKSRTFFFFDVYWKNPECFILLALDKYFLPPNNLPQKNFTASILWLLYVHVSNHRMIEVKATGSRAQGCLSQLCIIHCLKEG